MRPLLLVWLLCCVACGGAATTDPPGLLAGRAPIEAGGVDHPERVTDGVVARDGDPWKTDLTAVLSRGARLVYDLGEPTPIAAVYLHADNNDDFRLEHSEDGRRYQPLWQSGTVGLPGMRPRFADGLSARARFLRLTARGGDRYISVDELRVYAARPTPWPPVPVRARGASPDAPLELALALLCVALCLLGLLADRRLPAAARWGALCLPVAGAVFAWPELSERWPVSLHVLAWLRAWLAASGLLVLLRIAWGRAHCHRPLALTALMGLALISLASFYNLGRPWFHDHARGRPTAVHTYDMRVYFPVAKYFEELRFDGLYLASTKAYLEGHPGAGLERIRLRDLRTNLMVDAPEVEAEVHAVRDRFTDARWQSFVKDMGYFWRTMGARDYLGSMRDHGGNATPAWLAIAHLMFRNRPANETTLTLAALLDPLLLLLLMVAIARSFGVLTMAACLLIFGATDFPMLGSNWAGSTLRFDWMVAVGLGVCALRTGRPLWGGALLGYGAMMRAFPALALAFAAAPALWALVDRLVAREPGGLRAWIREQAGLWRMTVGALVVALCLLVLSSALFGFTDSWGNWREKIALHTDKANTNHVGLRTVVSWSDEYAARRVIDRGDAEPWTAWQKGQLETLARRAPLRWGAAILLCLLAFYACRRAPPAHAALIGMLLLPVLFYPANYYCHYVFLLPMLASVDDSPRGRRLWSFGVGCLSLLCVAQYFTRGTRFSDERFYYQSLWLLGIFTALLLAHAAVARRTTPATA